MADVNGGPRGFIIAAVVFWVLAAGLSGTAFVFYQESEQSARRTEQMAAESAATASEIEKVLKPAVTKLVQSLDSATTDVDAAIASIRSRLGKAPHIAAALAERRQRLTDLRGQVATLEKRKADLETQLARFRDGAKAHEDALNARVRKIEQDIADQTAFLNHRVGELNTQLAKVTGQIDQFDAAMRTTQDQISKDRIDFDMQLKLLLDKRRKAKAELRLIPDWHPTLAGRVLGADLAHDFAFVDLGTDHGVKEGMRFSVYPADVIFRPGLKPKGVIEIKRAETRRSRAQVVKFNLSDPVIVGDVLVNIAFDPTGYKPSFVFIRFLDIDGDRADDRDKIIRIIQDQGGRVLAPHVDAIDVNTDFALVGQEWNYDRPEEKKRDEADQPVMSKVIRRSITQLDVDTFLNYIGYPKWR